MGNARSISFSYSLEIRQQEEKNWSTNFVKLVAFSRDLLDCLAINTAWFNTAVVYKRRFQILVLVSMF